MKKMLCLLAALLFLPLAAFAEKSETDDTPYEIFDQNGAYVTHYLGTPDAGDEYIAHDNTHYVIMSVDSQAHTALAESKGAYQMPGVEWLHDDSLAVSSQPQRAIALYCTHSDESYVPTDGDSSITPRGGIYDVAESLKSNLEAQGITVHYDDSTHLPHDSGAYKRSRSTAESLLHNNVDAIFDIHRDGIKDPGQYETTIKGEDASMVRLLVGKSNQNASANKAFAAELKAVADELYPELVRDIYIGKGSYNQDLSPRSVLLEFGTHTIEKERATAATEFMAATIQKTLYGGISGAAHAQDQTNVSSGSKKGIWTGIAWIIGLVVVGACVFALASSGGMKPAAEKLGRGMREMTGGLFGKKNKK